MYTLNKIIALTESQGKKPKRTYRLFGIKKGNVYRMESGA